MELLKEKANTSKELMKLSGMGRYELIKGVIYKLSPSGKKHGFIVSKITNIVSNYVYENKLGITTGAETGYKLSSNPDTVRAPDMAFESNERLAQCGIIEGYSTVMPDLVVEVNSPSDSHTRVIKKTQEWLKAGVKGVWVIDPDDEAVAVYNFSGQCRVFDGGDYLEGGNIIPGFKCRVSEIFDYPEIFH